MEGSWEGSVGCVVHGDVRGECVCCGWMQCSSYMLSMAGIVCLVCRNWEQCWVCMVCWEFKLCCEILLLLDVAESDMDCLLCGRLWSEQC